MPTAMRMRIQELLLIFCNAAIFDYCIVIISFSMTYGTPQRHAHRFGDKVTQNHENKAENEKIFLQTSERFDTSDADAPKKRGPWDQNREDSPHSSPPVATPRRTAPFRRRKGEGEDAVALAHAHNAHTTVFRFSSSPFTFAMIRLKITRLRVKVLPRSVCRRKVKKKSKNLHP